ncbi:MAG: hypothetical protein KJ911_07860 [Alphaproteobacteria bacterium]|nr:hypothetical protein [Alphaproteobacteria bacterium]
MEIGHVLGAIFVFCFFWLAGWDWPSRVFTRLLNRLDFHEVDQFELIRFRAWEAEVKRVEGERNRLIARSKIGRGA